MIGKQERRPKVKKVIEGAAILVPRILAGLEQREVYDRKMD